MKYLAGFMLLCGLASAALADEPTGYTAVPSGVGMSQVENWVALWQKRLHLTEWKIDTQMVRSGDLRPETLGNLKWNSLDRTARIRVLDPADYDLPPSEVPTDIEYTIVHELVHLQLAVLPRDPGKRDVEEQVVNKIADALMLLDKGPGFRPRTVEVKTASPLPRKSRSTMGETAVRVAR